MLTNHLRGVSDDSGSDIAGERPSDSSSENEDFGELMDSHTYERLRRKKVSFCQEEQQEQEQEQEDQLPVWFDNRGFQYHARVLVIALPGFVITMAMGGDM